MPPERPLEKLGMDAGNGGRESELCKHTQIEMAKSVVAVCVCLCVSVCLGRDINRRGKMKRWREKEQLLLYTTSFMGGCMKKQLGLRGELPVAAVN